MHPLFEFCSGFIILTIAHPKPLCRVSTWRWWRAQGPSHCLFAYLGRQRRLQVLCSYILKVWALAGCGRNPTTTTTAGRTAISTKTNSTSLVLESCSSPGFEQLPNHPSNSCLGECSHVLLSAQFQAAASARTVHTACANAALSCATTCASLTASDAPSGHEVGA
jgi:hypothetical protein